MFKVKRLTCWWGDHFNESYDYRIIGYTNDPDLIKVLESIKVTKKMAENNHWPLSVMEGYDVFKIEPCNILTQENIVDQIGKVCLDV